jgi:methionyl-tRNA formyltransferase
MRAASKLGVSWHQVTHDFDAGDIAVQNELVIEDGESYLDINAQLAEIGAESMIDLLSDISAGTLTLTPQDSEAAGYEQYPQHKDFFIDSKWTAQHAYNFMCSTHVFDVSYRCQVGQYSYLLKSALDYDNNAHLDEAEIQPDRIYIPCMEGVLIASYIDKIPD